MQRDRPEPAITAPVHAGVESGDLRGDVDPFDMLTALSGFALGTNDPDHREQMIGPLTDEHARPG